MITTKLEEYRTEIEQIDKDILVLFKERIEFVKLVFEFKDDHDIPIEDPKREKYLTSKIDDQNLFQFYNTMITCSKSLGVLHLCEKTLAKTKKLLNDELGV